MAATTEGRYTTTVVGSYSVPRWYEALERLVEQGALSKADMAEAQYRATQAAILDQETAGIDVITGGEMHRRTNNRHAPPNAMLNFFWEKIPGFSKETRPKRITTKDPNVFHPAAVCTGPIGEAAEVEKEAGSSTIPSRQRQTKGSRVRSIGGIGGRAPGPRAGPPAHTVGRGATSW